MRLPGLLAGPLLVLAMVVLLFTLPVTLPIAMVLGKIDHARLRKVASTMQCVRCGHALGAASLDAAKAAATEARAGQGHAHGYLRLALPEVRCPGCGLFYRWNSRMRTLDAEPDWGMS